MDKSYYEILGVAPDATDDEIRTASNKKLRRLQAELNSPDAQARKKAEEEREQVGLARQTLLDSAKRKEYDLPIAAAAPPKAETAAKPEEAAATPQKPQPEAKEAPPAKKAAPAQDRGEKKQSSVLMLFDATASMRPLWDETAEIIQQMVKRITEAGDVQLKCCAYRDYCDGEDDIFEASEWSLEAGPLLDFVEDVSCKGGGDFPEAVEVALRHAVGENEVTRVILIGDAPPHREKDYREQARKLGEMGRPVFAFRVKKSPETAQTFTEIADLSGGQFADLQNYKDLLDMMAITVIHDVGGDAAVKDYAEKYKLSRDVEEYVRLLPTK